MLEAGVASTRCASAAARRGATTWNQIKADVTGFPVAVPEVLETAVLGSAMLGAVGIGAHPDVAAAIGAMTRIDHRIEPRPELARDLRRGLRRVRGLYPATAPILRRSPTRRRDERGHPAADWRSRPGRKDVEPRRSPRATAAACRSSTASTSTSPAAGSSRSSAPTAAASRRSLRAIAGLLGPSAGAVTPRRRRRSPARTRGSGSCSRSRGSCRGGAAAANITYPLELAGWSPERRRRAPRSTSPSSSRIDPRRCSPIPAELSGGDAPARRARPRARARARGPAPRRAVQRARRADAASASTSSCCELWERVGRDDRDGHPQHPRGDPRRRSGGRDVAAAGPGRRRHPRRVAAAAHDRGPRRRRRLRDRARRSGRTWRGGGRVSALGRGSRSSAALGRSFLVAWRLVVVVTGFPPFILPTPEAVAGRWSTAVVDGTIEPHLAATLVEVALGLRRRGRAAALVVGYALARSAARRARPVAVPRRRPGDADPRARPADRPVVRARAARQGPDLRADRLLPGRGLHDGRHPLGRCRAAGARARAPRDAPPGPDHARDPGRAADRSSAACASA